MAAIAQGRVDGSPRRGTLLRGTPSNSGFHVGRPVIGVGDSIMAGAGATSFLSLLKGGVVPVNLAHSGNSWNYDWPDDPHVGTLTDDVPAVAAYRTDEALLVAFAGTNGIAIKGNTASQEYADFEAWLTATLAAGWTIDQIYVATMLPRTGVAYSTVQAYNDLLVGGATTHGYTIIPYHLDPIMGGSGAEANTTYFADGIHPTNAGQARLANITAFTLGLLQPLAEADFKAGVYSIKGAKMNVLDLLYSDPAYGPFTPASDIIPGVGYYGGANASRAAMATQALRSALFAPTGDSTVFAVMDIQMSGNGGNVEPHMNNPGHGEYYVLLTAPNYPMVGDDAVDNMLSVIPSTARVGFLFSPTQIGAAFNGGNQVMANEANPATHNFPDFGINLSVDATSTATLERVAFYELLPGLNPAILSAP